MPTAKKTHSRRSTTSSTRGAGTTSSQTTPTETTASASPAPPTPSSSLTLDQLKQQALDAETAKQQTEAEKQATAAADRYRRGLELLTAHCPPVLLQNGTALGLQYSTGDVGRATEFETVDCDICIPGHLPVTVRVYKRRVDGQGQYDEYSHKYNEPCQLSIMRWCDRQGARDPALSRQSSSEGDNLYRCNRDQKPDLGPLLLTAERGFRDLLIRRHELRRLASPASVYNESTRWLAAEIFDVSVGRKPIKFNVTLTIPAVDLLSAIDQLRQSLPGHVAIGKFALTES